MSIIKVKRSANSGKPQPGVLKQGELAYSLLDDVEGNTLYIGTGDGAEDAAVAVGGKAFTDLLTATPGTPTANKAVVAAAGGRLASIVIGDETTDLTLTQSALTLNAGGLTFSGGNILSDGTATITGLPTPGIDSPDSQVATKGYVVSRSTGINVSDSEVTANEGLISGSDTFKFAGDSGVTVVYDDNLSTMTIGLQQQLDVDDDVAFGSVTVGAGSSKTLLGDDGDATNPQTIIKQSTPFVHQQFISVNGNPGTVVTRSTTTGMTFNITGHGYLLGDLITYESDQPISNLTDGSQYYAVNVTDNSFQLSLQEGGQPINNDGSDPTGGGTLTDVLFTENPVSFYATSDLISIGSPVRSTVAVGDNLSVAGNAVITGDLTVNGTSTTVNSTTVQIDDPVMELGTHGTVYDGLERGIKFNYTEGTAQTPNNLVGFFGYDHKNASDDASTTAGKFKFLVGATESSNTFTGTKATIVADVEGNVTGNASTATALQTAQTFALTGDVTGTVETDLSGGMSIATSLASDVSSSLGEYVKDLQVKGIFDITDPDPANYAFVADDDGSSLVIGTANNTTNGDIATVDAKLATATANTAPIVDKNDAAYDAGWKNDQGVAEFNSDQFSVTSGWVSIHTIDGGSYGTVTP